MTSSDTAIDAGNYPNCTIQYGPTPAFASSFYGANSFFSTSTFTDSDTGDQFYVFLTCATAQYSISIAYPDFLGTGPVVGLQRYHFTVGNPGNTCSPWLMSNGIPTIGFGPVTVTLSG